MLKYEEINEVLEKNGLVFKSADKAFVELFPLLIQYISLTDEVDNIDFNTDYNSFLNINIFADEITLYKDPVWFLLIRNSKNMAIKPTEDGLVFLLEYEIEVK